MRAIRQLGTSLAYAVPFVVVLEAVAWLLLGALRGLDDPLVTTASTAMKPSVRPADLVLLHSTGPGDVEVGDVIAYEVDGELLVRRVVEVGREGISFRYVVQGDNRADPEPDAVLDDQILGEVDTRLPYLGLALIVLGSLAGKLLLAAIFLFCVVTVLRIRWEVRSRRSARPVPAEPPTVPYGGADPEPSPTSSHREPDMSITPAELRHVRFATVRRGYDTEAVDRALESVADSIEELLHERHELVEKLRQLESDVERYHEIEATLSETLTLAEKAADEVKAEAQTEADKILAEARSQLAAAQKAAASAATASAATAPAPPAPAGQPRGGGSSLPDPAFIELLGETRAIRSLLQALLTAAPQGDGGSPFAPRQ